MKKIISILLSLALTLSMATVGIAASKESPRADPIPTPAVTLPLIDPDEPVDPPAQPMDNPDGPDPYQK